MFIKSLTATVSAESLLRTCSISLAARLLQASQLIISKAQAVPPGNHCAYPGGAAREATDNAVSDARCFRSVLNVVDEPP